MIDEKTLMQYSYKFQDIRQLEKDYLLALLLYEIYNEFDDELIFKGGTSLKYFYNLNRFSEDLDFSYLSKKHSLNSIYANNSISCFMPSMVHAHYIILQIDMLKCPVHFSIN